MSKIFDGTTNCECSCGYVGKIDTFAESGGLFFENKNRFHITGDCPECKINLINFHITKKQKPIVKELK